MVNGLSETVVVPDVARGQTLHHHIQSDRTALTQWKAIDHDYSCTLHCGMFKVVLRDGLTCQMERGWLV